MLISLSHRFLFIHVYKVAGVSVRSALDPYCYHPRTGFFSRFQQWLGMRKPLLPVLPIHAKAREVRAALPREIYDDYFKFAFVRNPWDWQVSLYQFMRQSPAHPQHAMIRRMRDFDEYIDWRVNHEVRLQKDFVTDEQGKLIVDFVGRFENLPQDFAHVCRVLNLTAELPHKNRSERGDYWMYYNDHTRKLVAEAFREDIELFGYQFEQGALMSSDTPARFRKTGLG